MVSRSQRRRAAAQATSAESPVVAEVTATEPEVLEAPEAPETTEAPTEPEATPEAEPEAEPTPETEATEAEGEPEAEEEEKQRSYTRWQAPSGEAVMTELKRLNVELTNAAARLSGRKDPGSGPYLQNVGWYDRTVGKLETVLTGIGTGEALAVLAVLRQDAAELTGYGTDKAQSAAGRKARDRVKAEAAVSAVTPEEPPATAAA